MCTLAVKMYFFGFVTINEKKTLKNLEIEKIAVHLFRIIKQGIYTPALYFV